MSIYQQRWFYRALEILPGALAWLALLIPVVFTFIAPMAVIIFMIFFDIYWFFKTLVMAGHLIVGYRLYQKNLNYDWSDQYQKLPDWQTSSLHHAVIFAIYKEPYEIVEASVESVVKNDFPHQQLIVVVATEARAGQHSALIRQKLTQKYSTTFGHFMTTTHPDRPGELKAKGANVTWAAKKLVEWSKIKKLNPSQIIVSTADADSRFHTSYFSALSIKYLETPTGDRQSYQPIPVFTNNIWQAPAISRILAFGSTFWQLIESTRPWRLITFSTHAMTLKTLIDINFWDITIVNEDSRQFWRAYFHYHGQHRVIPLYLPIYMDAVLADNFIKTLVNQYRQRLRWAYGVEHTPFVVIESLRHSEISAWDRLAKNFQLLEANYSWATASVYVAIVGWLPIVFNRQFSSTVLGVNFPIFASRLLSLTWIGLIISALISTRLLPPRPSRLKRCALASMLLQWILVPISSIFFGSLPAFDAQTRLMIGKYLGFYVTEKKAVTNPS